MELLLWRNYIVFCFLCRYEYEPALASQLCRGDQCSDTGVIAQEVAQVLPEAVKPAGNLVLENGISIENFLVVNKVRLFRHIAIKHNS